MTELSDELLVAYVDGQLVREQTRAVDKVLEHDDVVARRVEALKDAHGRFESAFEAILAGELIEILAAPMLPPRPKRKRGNGLAKIGIAVVGIGIALAALVGGYGWPLALRACSVTGPVATMQNAPAKAQSAPSVR
jgi:anti-sigma factor RsiW